MVRRAFTLVELLIVVIILGILAAVVIPQFSDASEDARLSSLQTNLQTIRGQLELYRLQHNNNYPDFAGFTAQMTKGTLVDGNPGADFGPYLQTIPNNPFTNTNALSAVPASGSAWYYSDTTGEFKADDGGTTNGAAHDTL